MGTGVHSGCVGGGYVDKQEHTHQSTDQILISTCIARLSLPLGRGSIGEKPFEHPAAAGNYCLVREKARAVMSYYENIGTLFVHARAPEVGRKARRRRIRRHRAQVLPDMKEHRGDGRGRTKRMVREKGRNNKTTKHKTKHKKPTGPCVRIGRVGHVLTETLLDDSMAESPTEHER